MNKGEWSELYVFLKLLAEGRLYTAGSDLKKNIDLYYPVIKVIKQSLNYIEPLHYKILNDLIIIIDSASGNELKRIPSAEFAINADKLFKIIKSASGSFKNNEMDKFIIEIESPLIKENSSSKKDIVIVIHDIITGHTPTLGFSIKSKLGGASTLFNASVSNNLQYIVQGLEELNNETLYNLNQLKCKKLIKSLNENNCKIFFSSILDTQFESNLQMIDSHFPIILAELLKLFYSGHSVKINELTEKVSEINPCMYKNNVTFPFYKHKIKGFLTACALGMTSKKPWSGVFEVSGGYLIVKEDGDVLCYHLYNWNDFQEYLFNSTFIDTPSTKRHKFGSLESNYLNLNFQIRFN